MGLKVFAGFLVFVGIYHFINPPFFDPYMPEWFPKRLANAAAGAAEILLGIGLLLSQYRRLALLGTLILMIMFVGIHFWDLLKPEPAIGNHLVATVRLIFQFLLVFWLYRLFQKEGDPA
jgi:uncharacterized membrane protein